MVEARWPSDFDARSEALDLLRAWVEANPDAHIVDGHILDVLRVSPLRVELVTTYETRSLVLHARPADGDAPPSSLPDPWEVDARTFEPRGDGSTQIARARSDGSVFHHACAPCEGLGRTRCLECGRARLFDASRCPACGGSGSVTCGGCLGLGRVASDVFVERSVGTVVETRLVEPWEGSLPTDLFLRLQEARPTTAPLHVQAGARMHRVEQDSQGYRDLVRDLGDAERIANAMLARTSVPPGARILDRRLTIHEIRAFRLRASNADLFYVHEPGPSIFPEGFWSTGLRGWLESFVFGGGRRG